MPIQLLTEKILNNIKIKGESDMADLLNKTQEIHNLIKGEKMNISSSMQG